MNAKLYRINVRFAKSYLLQKNKKQIVKLHKYNYAKNDWYKFKKNCEQFTY